MRMVMLAAAVAGMAGSAGAQDGDAQFGSYRGSIIYKPCTEAVAIQRKAMREGILSLTFAEQSNMVLVWAFFDGFMSSRYPESETGDMGRAIKALFDVCELFPTLTVREITTRFMYEDR